MDIKFNIPDWLKIPLRVLLPALWISSLGLLFLPNMCLSKLFLLQWRNENGFAIGLTFFITSSLIAVYTFTFLRDLLRKLTFKCRTLRQISKMNDTEQAIIFKLYTSPSFTLKLDCNEPLVQGLCARKIIYMGTEQHITLDAYTNGMPVLFTLQPYVYQSLDYGKMALEKKLKRLERKKAKRRDSKKEKISERIHSLRETYDIFCNGF